MNTPIADFLKEYAEKSPSRFHMPGHKGGENPHDITEVYGADVLYAAKGIIKESEENASRLFRTYATYYSTQGSTVSIKAMLYLVTAGKKNKVIIAGRNAHKSFIYGCGLLDITPKWIYPHNFADICSCVVTAEQVEKAIKSLGEKPCGVYITTPDYLGNQTDVKSIASVCDKYGVPLLVDNAHGGYTAFLEKSTHPIHNGAWLCCDSAHKTLPVLTGGGYLHFSKKGKSFADNAESALSMFSSTSPSYLVLESLDKCNAYLAKDFKEDLKRCVSRTNALKEQLIHAGFKLIGSEGLKLTVNAAGIGFTGDELAKLLRDKNIYCEHSDRTYTVFMLSPFNSEQDFENLEKALLEIKTKEPFCVVPPVFQEGESVMSVRDAMLSESETVKVSDSIGRICASPAISCPPAVPLSVSGEIITENTVKLCEYYGIDKILVVK